MSAELQRLEVVRAPSEFLSHFSIPQANPTQQLLAAVLGGIALPQSAQKTLPASRTNHCQPDAAHRQLQPALAVCAEPRRWHRHALQTNHCDSMVPHKSDVTQQGGAPYSSLPA